MSIRAQLTLFGGWSKDPCLRIFIRRVLGIQPCSMARFGRMFALGSGDGKTVPTKTCPSSLHRLSRTLSAEKKRVPLRFFTFPVKSTRVLFKEIALSGKCKNTVICGIKSMSNTANVENAGSINDPPGCSSTNHCDFSSVSSLYFTCHNHTLLQNTKKTTCKLQKLYIYSVYIYIYSVYIYILYIYMV